MKISSFRLKIALLSGAISGGLLIAASTLFWQLAYRMELARVDRELRNLGSPHLERVNGGDHWQRFEGALSFVAGSDPTPTFILWVKHEHRVLHRSKHWPAGLDPESFPQLTTYEAQFQLDSGQPLPPPPRRAEPISPQNPGLPRREPKFLTRTAGGREWRIGVMGNPYLSLVIGADLKGLTNGMAKLRNAFAATLLLVLLLVGAGAWLLAERALRPVTTLTQAVEGINARGLDQRIATPAHDREFARLATVFNSMMDRLERSFHQATRFSADAAHELLTPLTIMQGELETALQHAQIGSELQRTYGELLAEIQRLKSITQKLLLLSQADAGQLNLDLRPIDLNPLLDDLIEDTGILAGQLNLEYALQRGVRVCADRELLQQVLQNLATNAIKYNRPGGRIRFELAADNAHATLRATNTGLRIAPADQPRIFERFYRADPSRNRNVGGFGLGLSLSREIIRAHGGELALESSTEAQTTFVLTLPVAATDRA